MRARAGQPGMDAAWADGCPLSRFWLLPGPRRWQGAAPAGRSGAAGTPAAGEAAHAGWPAAALADGTGHEDLSVQVTEGLAPGPVPVSWSPVCAAGRPVRWLLVMLPRLLEPSAAGRLGGQCWQRPAYAAPRMAPDPSLQGSALAPHHGARAREQDWGVP